MNRSSKVHCPTPASIAMPSQRRRAAIRILVVSVAAVAIVCVRSATPPTTGSDAERYHDQSFRVSRVVDGDTLDIDVADGDKPVTRIRLWGVDTPEVSHGKRVDSHFGPEASAFAKKTLEGKTVHVVLSPRKTRGKYGRLLAYVFLERNGVMFNELLIEKGYCYADLRFKHHYFDRFKGIERRTRDRGEGLWAEVTLDKMPEWKQRFERRAREKGKNP